MDPHPRQAASSHPDPDLPAGIAADLRRLYLSPVPPRAGDDEAFLALARERAAIAARRSNRTFRIARWGVVAAAGLATGVFLSIRLLHVGGAGAPVALRGDVNRDGRVDILDALALARDLKGAAPAQPSVATARRSPAALDKYDLNHDGVIDERDVDLIAVQAVRLSTPERKS